MQHSVPVAYREPFNFGGPCHVSMREAGDSILEIILSTPELPKNFLTVGTVCINGEIVPRDMWTYVRPKPTSAQVPVAVTMHVALRSPGGGGNSTKSILAIVAAVALIVVTAFLAGPLGAAAFPVLGESVLGIFTVGQVLAGAVGIAGALAISALTAPPTASGVSPDTGQSNLDQAEAAAASGNVLDRGGAVPRVIGTRKVFPPFACEPIVELVDQDEIVEAIFVLNGPHLLQDIRIEGMHIEDTEDIEWETHEGWPEDPPIAMINRQGRTTNSNLELSTYSFTGDGVNLQHQSLPEDDLPIWHGMGSRASADEVWMHLLFPGGISDGSTNVLAIPFRIRFRKRGDVDWINLPEVHYRANTTNQLRAAILFKWAPSEAIPEPPSENAGFYYAHLQPPPQTSYTPNTPVDRDWDANTYFDDGAGNLYLYNGNAASTRIQNIAMYDNRLEVFLSESTFPKGMYEFQIKRGVAYLGSSFAKDTYLYGADSRDFFWYRSVGGIYQAAATHANISDRAVLVRLVSIWNEHPMPVAGNFAIIAIKALNRNVRQLSAQASGYVRDWNGSSWSTWTTTSNPAPHYVDILSGDLNLDPLPADLRDDTALVAWRTLCNTYDWTCDEIITDFRTDDVLNLLASCGYARPYQSDVYGVIVDSDRSADSPVQIFSRRNCASLRYEKAFARLPAGFNVTYRDEQEDDDQAQVTVYQSNPTYSDMSALESVSYSGMVNMNKVVARAQFDLDQASLRSTFYYFDTDIESIVCRRGSLVGVEHDILNSYTGDGYIVSKTLNAGSITGVVLDAEIPIYNETEWFSVTDIFAITDVFLIGLITGIGIRRTDGTISTHQLSNATGSSATLTFATPITDVATIQGFSDNDRKYGCLVVAGIMGTIYRRLLVHSILPNKDLTASLALVDEAPELIRYNQVPTGGGSPGEQHGTLTVTATGTGHFDVPAGVTSLTIEAWGGGGGGGSTGFTNTAPGGGGGGYSRRVSTVTPGQIVYYQVGVGGTGTTNIGGTGGTSWINTVSNAVPTGTDGCRANGGNFGFQAGGTGGGGTVGTTNFTGGTSGNGAASLGGGGGGGAGSGANGGAGTAGGGSGGAAGAGGSPDGGSGGAGDGGINGIQPGGGGGGSWFASGGNGGAGQVKFTW